MSWGDRTGPFGEGLRTGRGIGYCGSASRYMDNPVGRGFGRGRGRRCLGGFRRRLRQFWRMPFFGGASSTEEMELLKEEAEFLRENLKLYRDV